MDIRPIHTEADYKAMLKEISALMESDPDPGTPGGGAWASWPRWCRPTRPGTCPSPSLIRWKPSNSAALVVTDRPHERGECPWLAERIQRQNGCVQNLIATYQLLNSDSTRTTISSICFVRSASTQLPNWHWPRPIAEAALCQGAFSLPCHFPVCTHGNKNHLHRLRWCSPPSPVPAISRDRR